MTRGPRRVILSHDRSCNISCPSCRTRLILLGHEATDRLDQMVEASLLPLLGDAEDIKVTGSGDPFGSRHFRGVLKALCTETPPRRRIQLHTNGLLANEKAWATLGLTGHVSSVWVSIDAARPDTYAEVRRGGDFADLIPNLEFLGRLRQAGAIDSLRLDFVVQARNFAEMAEFADLADRVGADGVYFLRLRNWGHFTPDEFRAMDICDTAHPDHPRLLALLADPRLAAPRPGLCVDFGSLAPLLRRAAAGAPPPPAA
jgi:molybdenum cofactor biosynthesis enzyme MoaA